MVIPFLLHLPPLPHHRYFMGSFPSLFFNFIFNSFTKLVFEFKAFSIIYLAILTQEEESHHLLINFLMNIKNLTFLVFQKNFVINYYLFLAIYCYFNLTELKINDLNNDFNFNCHSLKAGCMFLFLVLSQTVFCIQLCHDLHLFLFRVSWLSIKVYLFHHFFSLNSIRHSRSSCLLFEVKFSSYAIGLDILYLFP